MRLAPLCRVVGKEKKIIPMTYLDAVFVLFDVLIV